MRRWLLLSLIVSSAGVTGSARGEGPTYHRDVERILQARCQECHRPGQVAPFPLLSYEHARKRASDIATVTEHRTMPPWHASTKEGGPFRDVAILTDAERATLADWAEAGAPEGDPRDAPRPRTWNSEWTLGTPDLVLTMPQSYTLGAEGRDELRVFVVPSGLAEGKWIAAVDFRPGNPKVVHHVLSAFDVRGAARKLDAADPEPGYHSVGGYGMIPSGGLGGWSPGKRPIRYADGVGRYLPAGSDILIQVHYHRSGKVETDATSIGLYYCKAPVDKQLRGAMVTPPRGGLFQRPKLLIPAGDPNYEVTGTLTLSEDSHLVAVTPHMHWIGKDFLLKATRPDGSTTTLIKVDDWDFNWQMGYDYETPVALPKGTRIDMVAHFDNSAANPDNQNKPPADVRWGEQTTDEMCIGFLHLTSDSEHRHNQPPPRFATQALNR